MNKLFSLQRVMSLGRKRLIEDYKTYLYSIVGIAGGLFVWLLFVQIDSKNKVMSEHAVFTFFCFAFIGGGILFIGHSFSSFRHKESTMNYLLIPATYLEKYIAEYFVKVVLLVISIPFIFISVLNLELFIYSSINSYIDYSFQSFSFLDNLKLSGILGTKLYLVFGLPVFMFFNMAWLGSIIFVKQPLLKTILSVALVVGFNVSLLYLMSNFFGGLRPSSDIDYTFFPTSKESAIQLFILLTSLFNIMILTIGFFKLKEKEA